MFVIGIFSLILTNSIQVESTPYKIECNEKLLENRNIIPDNAYSESSYEDNFSGKYARESSEDDQAWCPKKKLSNSVKEFVGIDLGQLSVIKMVMTRGRNAVGYMSAQSYYIMYKLESSSKWKYYRNYSGSKELMGRKDPLNEKFISLEPPLVARWIRIYPLQPSNEKICLKLQLYGCVNTNHVVEYQTIDGSDYNVGSVNIRRFKDVTYDGRILDNGTLVEGIGKLTDYDIERGSTKSPIMEGAQKFIGWNMEQLKTNFIDIRFRFDSPRNFSNLYIRAANHFDHKIRIFKKIEIITWLQIDSSNIQTRKLQNERDNRIRANRWIEVDMKGVFGDITIIRLYFDSQWIILSEIHFESDMLKLTKDLLKPNIIKKQTDITKESKKSRTDQSVAINSNEVLDDRDNKIQLLNKDFNQRHSGTNLSLSQTLGIICGSLALLIIIGFAIMLYLHGRRHRSSPMKERVICQPKYQGNNDFFLANDSEYYTSAKLSKGTFIPFNISPYKYIAASTHQSPTKLPAYEPPTFLTPNHHHHNHHQPQQLPFSPLSPYIYPNTSSQLLLNKSSPKPNQIGNRSTVDNCVYTSLPASDTDSIDTNTDHKANLPNINTPISNLINNYWTTKSALMDKVYINNGAVESDRRQDETAITFQCHPDYSLSYGVNGVGMIFTNKQQSQDYESFKAPIWYNSDDDLQSTTWDVTFSDLSGCCGNSTFINQSLPSKLDLEKQLKPIVNIFNLNLTKDYLNELSSLGRGLYGEIKLDFSSPINSPPPNIGSNNQESYMSQTEVRAIKILNEHASSDTKSKFLQELYVSSLLKHENIVSVLSAHLSIPSSSSSISSSSGTDLSGAPQSYIVTEYSPFGDLYNFMQQYAIAPNHIITNHTIHKILLQLADAMNYLANKHIIHRDVSCRNCLVTQINLYDDARINNVVLGYEHKSALSINIKLTDCAMSQPRYHGCYVRPSSIVKSPIVTVSSLILPLRWSSPEVILANQFSEKSDVYAFGVSVWEMFTKCEAVFPLPELTNEQIIHQSINIITSKQMLSYSSLASSLLTNQQIDVSRVTHLEIPEHNCAKEIADLIRQCTDPFCISRPNFHDISTFLQHNLSVSRDCI